MSLLIKVRQQGFLLFWFATRFLTLFTCALLMAMLSFAFLRLALLSCAWLWCDLLCVAELSFA
jgi:hypothetical protein